jgi:hypothetical protein
MFNIGQMAKNKVKAKRKRKGLGEMKQRENNIYKALFFQGTSLVTAHTLAAPLERVRII